MLSFKQLYRLLVLEGSIFQNYKMLAFQARTYFDHFGETSLGVLVKSCFI